MVNMTCLRKSPISPMKDNGIYCSSWDVLHVLWRHDAAQVISSAGSHDEPRDQLAL